MASAPNVLILRAAGINRDTDAAAAIALAGGTPECVHINRVAAGDVRLANYAMLIVPGGFSYGDHLGAGKLLAVDLIQRLGDQLAAFVDSGRPVLGICNGFQVLVKAGVLPGAQSAERKTQNRGSEGERSPLSALRSALVTLTDNASRRFECRWVHLAADTTSPCLFTRGLMQPIEVPVAHGEGRVAVTDPAVLDALQSRGQVALRYVALDGGPAAYPLNPNGSAGDIAGICNAQGNVLGLMPHPEDAVLAHQHPRWTRQPWRQHGDGLALFQNAIAYLKA
ncbi:MAG: phosphoribosylformylglycinamidine synthase I [Chloroflexales bacterium]|nr:phosphoribosylformylglycinamidine synthase I [Chloroflexales bacterium]